jgi:peroxiredoxin
VRAAAAALVLFAAGASAGELRPWTGGAAPALALTGLDGRSYDLGAYRGRVVLVNFWATWCEPCREEMPAMNALRRSLAGRPFEVLAVNLGEPESRIRRFLEAMPLDFPVLLDRDMAAAKAWQARILPASFVVGPDGHIRYSALGALDWNEERTRRRVVELLAR